MSMANNVSMEKVKRCFEERIKHLKVKCADWEKNLSFVVDDYCKPEQINSGTSITNVCNVVNHVSQIKTYKSMIEELEQTLWMIEIASNMKD